MRYTLIVFILLASISFAQTKSKPATSPVSSLTLTYTDLAQLNAARAELDAARQNTQKALKDWAVACEALKAAKGLPAKTSCRIGDGAIILPPLSAPTK
jgi:hypothetical protein